MKDMPEKIWLENRDFPENLSCPPLEEHKEDFTEYVRENKFSVLYDFVARISLTHPHLGAKEVLEELK